MKTPIPSSTPAIFGILQSHLCQHVAFKARNMAQAEMEQMMQEQMAMGQQPQQMDMEPRVAQLIAAITEEVMGALMPPPQGPDPLVELRSKELDIKAMDMQRKASEFSEKQAFEEQREAERQDITREKIDSSEDIAQLRANVNMERIDRMGGAGRGE